MVKIVLGTNSFETDDVLDEVTERFYRLWLLALGGVPAQQAELDALVDRLKTSNDILIDAVGDNDHA